MSSHERHTSGWWLCSEVMRLSHHAAAARLLALLPLALLPLACSGDTAESSDTITVYTCVNDETIQPLIEEFERTNEGTEVELFRAATGELNARVAADVRGGGLQADVIWACDPLTMEGYVDQGLVGGWTPPNAAAIPSEFRSPDYVGVAVLYMVAVYDDGLPPPKAWSDLAGPEYVDGVAVPDPSYAASALGALGYFEQASGYGLDFYAELKDNGATQVSTPDDVVIGVAQGLYDAGITIANSAYVAQESGSPIGVVWPEPGAVAIYGPAAPTKESDNATLAQDFVSFVVSKPGQQTLAAAGSYPTLPGISGPTLPENAPIVYPDWSAIGADQDTLLEDYQEILGG